jgi:hypothetical protein
MTHPRNLDDGRLKKIADAGGVICINSVYLKNTSSSPERVAALKALGTEPDSETATEAEIVAYLKKRAEVDAKFPPVRANFEDFIASLTHTLKLVGPEHVGIGADWDGGGGVDRLRGRRRPAQGHRPVEGGRLHRRRRGGDLGRQRVARRAPGPGLREDCGGQIVPPPMGEAAEGRWGEFWGGRPPAAPAAG